MTPDECGKLYKCGNQCLVYVTSREFPKVSKNQVTALIFVQLCGKPSAVATLMGHGLALAKVAQTTKVSCSKYAAEIHFYKQRAGLSFSLLKARYF